MLKIDFSNCLADNIGPEHGVTKDELAGLEGRVKEIHKRWQDDRARGRLAFLDLPYDTIESVMQAAKGMRFQDLLVLGIGGSALGLRVLAQALLPPFFSRRRLFVMDNIDPDHFGALIKQLDLKKTCINVISKSGKTIETASQFYIVQDLLTKKLGVKKWKEHVVITTDPKSGPLREIASKEGLATLPIPTGVGGRFSVLSAVGLFPAALVGIDVVSLVKGAREMVERCSNCDLEENIAYKNGAVCYIMDTVKQKKISVIMPYSDSLALFADWYAQLWAESLGKGGRGQTPVKALGVTDQHSQLQLYMDGPNDKIITFAGVEKFATKLAVPKKTHSDFSHIAGRDLGEILHAEQRATTQALTEAKRPNITVTLPRLDARSIGQLLMMYEISTAFTGYLYGINPFDQPGVERGKELTKEILCTYRRSSQTI